MRGTAGTYTVTATVRDDDAGEGTATHGLVVRIVDVLPDADGRLVLVVGGTSGDDLIRLLPVGHTGAAGDVLIGGDGADDLVAGAADDILAAGGTVHDGSAAALRSLLREWTRVDVDYAGRVAHLLSGGGLNGDITLDTASRISDHRADTLAGAAGEDWYLVDDDAAARDRIVGDHDAEVATSGGEAGAGATTEMIDWSATYGAQPGGDAGGRRGRVLASPSPWLVAPIEFEILPPSPERA